MGRSRHPRQQHQSRHHEHEAEWRGESEGFEGEVVGEEPPGNRGAGGFGGSGGVALWGRGEVRDGGGCEG